jgi:hypothetical protein
MTEIIDYEYTPCIRKGKYIQTTHKKKKYEPKAQKRNRTRYQKMTEQYILNDNKDSLTELMEILNTENTLKWNSNYDNIYKEYNLEEIEEFKQGYINIKKKLREWTHIFQIY